jgi:hypothetical protein
MQKLVAARVEHRDRAILPGSSKETIGHRIEVEPLRLCDVPNRVDPFTIQHVQHLDGSVAKRRHKQTVAFQVRAEMINSALHVRERNAGSHRQSLRLCRG